MKGILKGKLIIKMNYEKKTVKVDFTNPEGRMKLTIESKKKKSDSLDLAIEVMKAFDQACNQIKEKGLKNGNR